jgi:hypothetical protein
MYSLELMMDGKTVRNNVQCYSKINKFEKLVHLVSFTVEIYRVIRKSLCTWWLPYNRQVCRDILITLYYDARTCESQMHRIPAKHLESIIQWCSIIRIWFLKVRIASALHSNCKIIYNILNGQTASLVSALSCIMSICMPLQVRKLQGRLLG